jgi:hypothetical protein
MNNTEDKNKQTGISIFKGILGNKASVTADQIISLLAEGEADPLYVGIVLKKFEKIQEAVFKNPQSKDNIIEELKKYLGDKGKTVQIHGSKIQLANTGYWDYSTTEDPLLEALTIIEKEVKEQIKLRQEELQNKAMAWEKRTTPKDGKLGIDTSFVVTFEELPKLVWEESVGEIHTSPPIKKGSETLRFFV